MDEDTIDLRIYIDILLRRRRVILLLTVLVALAAFISSQFLPAKYQAVSGLVVAPKRADLRLTASLGLTAEDAQRVDLRYRNAALVEIAGSLEIAQRVIERNPDLAIELETRNPARLAGMMAITGKEDWISIQAEAPMPQLAVALARAWVHEAAAHINAVYAVDAVVESNLEVEAQAAWTDYQQAQAVLENFLRDSRIVAIEGQIQGLENSLDWTTFDMQLANTYRQEALLQQLLLDAHALRQHVQGGGSTPAGNWGTALAFVTLQSHAFGGHLAGQSYTQSDAAGMLDLTIQGVTAGFWQFNLSGEPPVVTVEDVDNLIVALEAKLVTVQARFATPVTESGNAPARTAQIAALAQELTALRAQLEQEGARQLQLISARGAAWESYTALINKLREVRVERAIAIHEVQVAFEPFSPRERSTPRVSMNMMIGVMAGLLAGVVWALGQAYLGQGLVIETRTRASRWLLNASGLPNFPRAVPTSPQQDV